MNEAPTSRLRVIRSSEPARNAGALLADALAEVQERRSVARLGIPGGSALAALRPARESLGALWSCVALTWVDERCVPFEDAASNRGAAYRSGALSDEHPPATELPLVLDEETLPAALRRVRIGLDRDFEGALDVLLLGLGEDGHIASIFPGWVPPPDRPVAFVCSAVKPPPRRITLTPVLLQTADRVILLAEGERKRSALMRVVTGDPELAVTSLSGLVVVTDLDLDPDG